MPRDNVLVDSSHGENITINKQKQAITQAMKSKEERNKSGNKATPFLKNLKLKIG